MDLKCKKCAKDICTSDKKCPHCGVVGPAIVWLPLKAFLILFSLIFIIKSCVGESDEDKSARLIECKKSLKCWSMQNELNAIMKCQSSVDRFAKYSTEWTDSITKPIFKGNEWANEKEGIIRYLGDTVKFQNGFGAWTNMIYMCEFNPATSMITHIEVKEGKI